jgi:non-canonical purine NTP pyrophosphatase (RdgB/HAM1 family)
MNKLNLEDITVITSNKHKIKELTAILGTGFRLKKIEIPEIQSLNIDEVITEKAKTAYQKIKKPVLVEDVSFEIDAINGLPGPFVKFFLQRLGTVGIIKIVGNKSTKTKVTAAVAIYDGVTLKIFKDKVSGTLSKTSKGESGFGFDRIFIPKGYKQTYAQMDPKLKDKISHRAKALKKLKEYLTS